jgi:hypothetical protein
MATEDTDLHRRFFIQLHFSVSIGVMCGKAEKLEVDSEKNSAA